MITGDKFSLVICFQALPFLLIMGKNFQMFFKIPPGKHQIFSLGFARKKHSSEN